MSTKRKAVIEKTEGGKLTVVIQREHDGDYWATAREQNSDKGYTLFANGSAVKQEWRDGELVSGVKVGTWKLVPTNPSEIPAVVRTWNGNETHWGPMPLWKAIGFACDEQDSAHRYVEVKGVIVFDYDEVINAAREAVRKEAGA